MISKSKTLKGGFIFGFQQCISCIILLTHPVCIICVTQIVKCFMIPCAGLIKGTEIRKYEEIELFSNCDLVGLNLLLAG